MDNDTNGAFLVVGEIAAEAKKCGVDAKTELLNKAALGRAEDANIIQD